MYKNFKNERRVKHSGKQQNKQNMNCNEALLYDNKAKLISGGRLPRR